MGLPGLGSHKESDPCQRVVRFGAPREADSEGDAGFGRLLGFRAGCQPHTPIPVSLLTLKSFGSGIAKFVLGSCIFLLCCYRAVP